MSFDFMIDPKGQEIIRIIGQEYIHRVDPGLPVWGIKGLGDEYRERRIKLLGRITNEFSASLLKFSQDDSKIRECDLFTDCLAPSVWVIPSSIDAETLYDLLWQCNWGIYPVDRSLKPLIIDSGNHKQRLIWMRYHNVPFVIENNHWLDTWFLTLNPQYDNSGVYETLAAFDLKMDYPMVGRFLNILAFGSTSEDKDWSDNAGWLAGLVSDEDRTKFIQECERLLGSEYLPLEELKDLAGIGFSSETMAGKWLRNLTNIFTAVDKIESEQKRHLRIVENVIQEFYPRLVDKRMAAEYTGVVVKSVDPYESSARIDIKFDEGDKQRDPLESHIYTCYVPLYLKGLSVNKNVVRASAEKELDSVISHGPYFKQGDGIYSPNVALPARLNFCLMAPITILIIIMTISVLMAYGC